METKIREYYLKYQHGYQLTVLSPRTALVRFADGGFRLYHDDGNSYYVEFFLTVEEAAALKVNL